MDNTKNDSFTELIPSIIHELAELSNGQLSYPKHLPSRDVVTDCIDILRNLLFPGYFDRLSASKENLEYYMGVLLIEVKAKLEAQIQSALLHDSVLLQQEMDAETQARDIVGRFMAELPAIRKVLMTDVDATLDGDPAARNRHEIIFAYPGIYAISVFRLAHALHSLSVPLIPRMMTEHAHSITGIDIHPGAQIGHHFFIDHGTGVVIGETTQIGNYVKIYQGVTLGALSTRGGQSLRGIKRHPTLEDEVTVYSSTSIFGGETVIGKGAVIGSNSFITASVPAGTKVSIKTPALNYRDMNGTSSQNRPK